MKRHILFLLFLLGAIIYSSAQNYLSPIWKYAKIENFNEVKNINWNNSPELNLLLSWERQGLSWIDKNLVMRNTFLLDKKASKLQMEFSLQADIQAIYLNGIELASKINNSFWSNRGQKTIVPIPDSLLKLGINEVNIKISNLSYTGGLSYNFFSVNPQIAEYTNNLSINLPTLNHVYLANTKKELTLISENHSDNKVHITIHNDFHKLMVDENIPFKKGKQEYVFDLAKYKLEPGLYECVAISEGQTYSSTVDWFAIQPEEISNVIQKPSDFDTFWLNAINDLHQIDPQFKIKKVDSLCSTTRNGYIVEMKSLGNLTIRGYYFVPKTEGKHPAVLHVPGYSYGFENLNGFKNRQGNCAELALCVRAHGISKDIFNPWDSITLWAVGICRKETYVYRSIFMDCVQAVEFLKKQPEIDNTRIGVAGGSQGGGLTLATAALCNNDIAACAFFDPWLCDIRNQAKIRTMVNKELDFFKTYPGITCNSDQMLSVLDYFDTKSFTPGIKCPVYFLTSLFDDDCPSRCGFAAFNNIKTHKEYLVFPKDSHLGESGQYDKLFYFVENILEKK